MTSADYPNWIAARTVEVEIEVSCEIKDLKEIPRGDALTRVYVIQNYDEQISLNLPSFEP